MTEPGIDIEAYCEAFVCRWAGQPRDKWNVANLIAFDEIQSICLHVQKAETKRCVKLVTEWLKDDCHGNIISEILAPNGEPK